MSQHTIPSAECLQTKEFMIYLLFALIKIGNRTHKFALFCISDIIQFYIYTLQHSSPYKVPFLLLRIYSLAFLWVFFPYVILFVISMIILYSTSEKKHPPVHLILFLLYSPLSGCSLGHVDLEMIFCVPPP